MSSRGRRSGGFTLTQPLRPGQMYDSQTTQTRPPDVSQSVDTHRDQIRDQLPPVLDILADSLSDLKNTMSTLVARSTARESQARNAEKSYWRRQDAWTRKLNLMVSVNLGLEKSYWRLRVAWTRKFRREMLVYGVPLYFWTHYAWLCCGEIVLNCGKRNLKHLGMLNLPENRLCYWKFRMTVVRFLTLTGGSGLSLWVGCVGNLKTLDCIIFSGGFLRISLNNVRMRQFTNNLDQELLDDLVSPNMYAPGTYSCLLVMWWVSVWFRCDGNHLIKRSTWRCRISESPDNPWSELFFIMNR